MTKIDLLHGIIHSLKYSCLNVVHRFYDVEDEHNHL